MLANCAALSLTFLALQALRHSRYLQRWALYSLCPTSSLPGLYSVKGYVPPVAAAHVCQGRAMLYITLHNIATYAFRMLSDCHESLKSDLSLEHRCEVFHADAGR